MIEKSTDIEADIPKTVKKLLILCLKRFLKANLRKIII
ncbi:hypothetical protein THER_1510 [Thermodesulfovibrio sp. N1]|nr:hypothetical protein THER_1510 [Thermodesulfovibrio sp. N1]